MKSYTLEAAVAAVATMANLVGMVGVVLDVVPGVVLLSIALI